MQHSATSCYNHCLHVAYYTYLICKKFNLDYFSASRAAMLHDFFLYDWHEPRKVNSFKELHAFAHPKIALQNSLKNFELNDLEITERAGKAGILLGKLLVDRQEIITGKKLNVSVI